MSPRSLAILLLLAAPASATSLDEADAALQGAAQAAKAAASRPVFSVRCELKRDGWEFLATGVVRVSSERRLEPPNFANEDVTAALDASLSIGGASYASEKLELEGKRFLTDGVETTIMLSRPDGARGKVNGFHLHRAPAEGYRNGQFGLDVELEPSKLFGGKDLRVVSMPMEICFESPCPAGQPKDAKRPVWFFLGADCAVTPAPGR